jgi:EAL domain-containing protein (putative c-di-GMP-specific phosphodiesterase class I)
MILFYSPINGSGTGKDLRVLLGTGTAVAGDSYKINQIKEKNIDTRILNRIIREQRIYSLYQPIISLKRGTILGMEALARGVDPQSGETVPPDTMFSRATKDGRGLELDRVCRDAALKGFAGIEGHKRLLLSLNLDISCVDRNAAGSGFLLSQTQASGISNNHIVLEILESKACSTEALLKFVSTYKNKNFLIALDDVGSGFSNLERIPLVKPDILKLDRSLVREVDKHFYKQELVRSFVRTAQCIGSQVVAEGVEGPGHRALPRLLLRPPLLKPPGGSGACGKYKKDLRLIQKRKYPPYK